MAYVDCDKCGGTATDTDVAKVAGMVMCPTCEVRACKECGGDLRKDSESVPSYCEDCNTPHTFGGEVMPEEDVPVGV